MASDAILWLQSWFLSQCDGDWEHQHGVKVETLDNPGWAIEIGLTGTPMAETPFEKFSQERSEHDWVFCSVVDARFRAACGPSNLAEAIEVFRSWVDARD